MKILSKRAGSLLAILSAVLIPSSKLEAQGASGAPGGAGATRAEYAPSKALAPAKGMKARRAELAAPDPLAGKNFLPLPLPEFSPPKGNPAPAGAGGVVGHRLATGATEQRALPQNGNPGAAAGSSPPGLAGGVESPEPQLFPNAFSGLSEVADPSPYPWRTTVKMYGSNANGGFVCSGTLIHPKYVLTAGHCVYDHQNGAGWANSMTVVPAYADGVRPYGSSEAVYFTSFSGWTVNQDFNFDLAIVELDRPIGTLTGWLGYGWNSNNSYFSGLTMNNASYPAESPFDGQTMFFRSGTFDSIATELFEHNNPSYGGQSGSGSYRIDGSSNRYVHSVVSYHRNGRTITGQPRITEAKFDVFQSQIASTTPASPDLQLLDMNVSPGAVASGSALTTADFLLFNNSSASWSGEVTFDIYLSTNQTISTGDTYLQTRFWNGTLAAGATIRLNANSVPPVLPPGTAAGNYHVGAILTVADSDDTNNVTRADDTAPLAVTGGTPPVNDNWASAIGLNLAPASVNGTNVNATIEPSEPDTETAGATVWWFYRAQGNGTLTVNTSGSDFDTMLHVYEGFESGSGLPGLTLVADDDDSGEGTLSQVSFPVIGDKYYEIRVGGFEADSGSIVLNTSFVPSGGTPAISISGNGQQIQAGDSTPAAADGTDFGQVAAGDVRIRPFVISNTGTAYLNLTGSPAVQVSGSGDFTIETQPFTAVAPGGTASFSIRYLPGSTGSDLAVISIPSNDPALPAFSFSISGQGVPNVGTITGTVWQDLNGNGSNDAEPGLGNTRVYLDLDDDGVRDASEPSQLSAAGGGFSFSGINPGLYRVRIETTQTKTHPGQAGGFLFPPEDVVNPSAVPLGAKILTRTSSVAKTHKMGERVNGPKGEIRPLDLESNSVIGLDAFRTDPRFAGIDGSGWAIAILDTGMDVNHPAFGPDTDGNGVADRIVYQYDFVNNDADASDDDDHGSNVASIAAASSASLRGVAPGASMINLKVLGPGGGTFGMLESALQWVAGNAGAYDIAAINMSLGDSGNYTTPQSLYGISDEMAAIAALDVAVVSASGNDYYGYASTQGVGYPSADANSMSVGASFDANIGAVSWFSGAQAFSTGVDRITPFSQRHQTLTTIFAPGALSSGAGANGDVTHFTGTSQASPVVAGVCVLAQQLAVRQLGRRLTQAELVTLMRNSAVTINDGDNEDDNVGHTGLNFPRINVMALGEAILAMSQGASPHSWLAKVQGGKVTSGANFGVQSLPAPEITSALAATAYRTETFTYQIAADHQPASFSISGQPSGMTINATTGVITWTPSTAGYFPVTITATNPTGSDSAQLVIAVSDQGSLQVALDTTRTITGGAQHWYLQNAVNHDGVDAARSPQLPDSASSYFETQVTPPATGGTVKFWWKVSSEGGYDFLRFSVDGVVVTSISGNVDWTQVSHVVAGGGVRTLRWEYSKDSSFSSGLDAGFVDQLSFDAVPSSQVVVTTATDEDNGNLSPAGGTGVSLREALLHAPADAVISFAPPMEGAVHSLTLGQISIGKNLRIEGAASGPGVIVEKNAASALSRIFEIQSGKVVSMSGLVIRNGSVSLTNSSIGNGGGISNNGTLALTRCTVSGCSGRNGGGIDNNATLTLDQCSILNNTSRFNGAGIDSAGPLTATRSTFSGNAAGPEDGGGGAIQHTSGLMILESCTLSGNSAAYGGAIDGDGTSTISLVSTTISGNVASQKGGAIEETSGTLRLWNCIVAGNTCQTAAGSDSGGPDIFGEINDQPGSTLQGMNLLGSLEKVSGTFDGILGAPVLSPLGDYGGLTATRPPLPGSPAIDAGMASLLATDQRGMNRFRGTAVDLGAVETQPLNLIVTNSNDSGSGSLRAAVASASGGVTVTFSPSVAGQTITLTTGEIVIGDDVHIDASGAPGVVVSGNGGASGIFSVSSGVEATITDLILRGGQAMEGGAIHNAGVLTLERCILSGNEAVLGGAIYNDQAGDVFLMDCRLSDNLATAGGACYNEGLISIAGSVMDENYAEADGGAIWNGGDAGITSSVITDNASSYSGGAIGSSGELTITRTTLARNESYENGGGISTFGGSTSLNESTVSENSTGGFGGGIWHAGGFLDIASSTVARNRAIEGTGGGIYSYEGAEVRRSTVAGNESATEGGGIYLDDESQLTLQGSIVAGNTAPSGKPDLAEVVGGSLVDQGHNLLGSVSGLISSFSGLVADPQLLPLSIYGGPTPTMPPAPGSPAINAGGPTGILLDQRGFARVVGGQADIGSVETGNVAPVITVNTAVDENNGSATGGISLREALAEVPVGGTVAFAPALSGQIFTLTAGRLVVAKPMSIDASGLAIPVALTGAGPQAIEIAKSAHAVVRSLRISGFDGVDDNVGGAAILNRGGLLMEDCEIDGNFAMDGGGVSNEGSLQAYDCLFTDNESAGEGGAVANRGLAELVRCRLIGNGSSNSGAGIWNVNSITVIDSWISGNWANTSGGGIENQGIAKVIRCTLSANHAEGSGGGGVSNDGVLEIASSTVAENVAHFGSGAGIANGGLLTVTECTVAANVLSDEGTGGGIVHYGDSFTLRNSIVANNVGAADPPVGSDIEGSIDTQQGVNLVSSTEGITGTFTGITGNPLLSQLGDHGGPTPTMLPQAGSPAIDAGGLTTVTVDQRGLQRLVGTAIDIGAVEVQAGPVHFVTTAADAGPGSLRATLAAAPAGATIRFNASLSGQTIALAGGPLVIGRDVVIDGQGLVAGIMLSGTAQNRVIEIQAGSEVVLAELNIGDGRSGQSGGGIHNAGQLTLRNTTVCHSLSFLNGGGIWNSGQLLLINSTVAGNFAADAGGGIFNDLGSVVAIHSTISENIAFFGAGGGIGNDGTVALQNSVVAGNSAPGYPLDPQNGFQNYSGNAPVETGINYKGASPRLAPLGYYGSALMVMPPLPGSPLIEGAVLLSGSPATDQLGNPRPNGPLPDIGAVEAIAFATLGLADGDGDGMADLLESTYGMTIGVNDSGTDSDGDGSSDVDEIGNMTDPDDASDFLRILSFVPAPGFHPVTNRSFLVTFPSFPGLSYSVESDLNLDFDGPDRVILQAPFEATGYGVQTSVQLRAGKDFIRVRRE